MKMEVSVTSIATQILIIISLNGNLEGFMTQDHQYLSEHSMKMCNEIAKKPYFSPEMIVGKPWRIYYEWHMRVHANCLDMKFKYATRQIVTRIYNDMSEFLSEQPNWSSASMLVKMGSTTHEMLLLTDQGPEGRLVGVPNVARDGRRLKFQSEIPLMKFQMKLYGAGRYLLMIDCAIGAGTLSIRSDQPPPTKEEINKLIEKHQLETGYHACVNFDAKNPIG